jgi:hypothetical protein
MVEGGLFEREEAVLHVIERIVGPLGSGSMKRHHTWTRDCRTAAGVQTEILSAPLSPPMY